MKKSLLVTIDFPPVVGGVSHSLWNCANSFAPEDIVVLTQPAEVDVPAPFQIIRKRFYASWFVIWPRWLPLLWHMRNEVRSQHADVIQAGQLLPVGTGAWLLHCVTKIPYTVFVYGQDLVISARSRRKSWLIRQILRHAAGVVANSRYTRDLAIRRGADPDRTIVSYPSVPANRYREVYAHDIDHFRAKHRLDNAFTLLSVGNLVKRKGYDIILAAIEGVKSKIPHLAYLIAGVGPDRNALERDVQRRSLDGIVQFVGGISDEELAVAYHATDVFILLPRELRNNHGAVCDVEGFGMVFLEANLYHKPVIAGRSGGVPEAVADGISGVVVDPNDPVAVSEAILDLYRDPDRRSALGRQGHQRAIHEFSLSPQTAVIHKLIHDIPTR